MRRYMQRFKEAFLKGDLILLLLCVVTTAFGCLMIASTTIALSVGPDRRICRRYSDLCLDLLH